VAQLVVHERGARGRAYDVEAIERTRRKKTRPPRRGGESGPLPARTSGVLVELLGGVATGATSLLKSNSSRTRSEGRAMIARPSWITTGRSMKLGMLEQHVKYPARRVTYSASFRRAP